MKRFILVLLLALAGCGDDSNTAVDGGKPDGDAATDGGDATMANEIAGKNFRSEIQAECGPDDPVCYWRVSFAESTFTWTYSDQGDTGTYTYDAGIVSGILDNASNTMVSGVYDSAAGTLTWNRRPYVEVVTP